MSNQNDDTTTADPAQEPDPAATPPPQAQNSDDSGSQTTDKAIPYSRFKEVNDQLKELKEWRAEQEAAAAAAETAQLQEQGKLQELADKLKADLEKAKPKVKTAEKYEQVLTQYLEKERDGLPDHILPILDKLPVDEQLSYIAEHREALKPAKTPPPNTNGADGGTGGRVVETAAQRREKKQQKGTYRL
jgi:hypothetical protein